MKVLFDNFSIDFDEAFPSHPASLEKTVQNQAQHEPFCGDPFTALYGPYFISYRALIFIFFQCFNTLSPMELCKISTLLPQVLS